MLRMLAGAAHEVYTGVAIVHGEEEKLFYEKTDVTFWELTPKEIDDYIASEEPFDKAGSYGIQGIGAKFVKDIKGDVSAKVTITRSS